MASGGTDEVIRVYNLKTKREIGELDRHTDQILSLEFIGRKHLISGSMDGGLCLWQTKDWKCVHTLKGHKPGPVTGIGVHPSGNVAFSTSSDNSLRMWDLTSGRPASRNRLRDFKQLGLPTWSLNGDTYSVVGDDRTVLIFSIDNENGKPEASIVYRSRVNATCFLGNDFLATGCEDGTVRIVNLGGDEVAQLDCSENSRVRSMRSLSAPNNDALILVVALSDGVIQFWKIPSDPKQSKKLGKEIKVGSSTHVTCMTALLSLPEPENEVPVKTKDKRSEDRKRKSENTDVASTNIKKKNKKKRGKSH